MSDPGRLEDPGLVAWVRQTLGVEPIAAEPVQTLWSGYGQIWRLRLDGAVRGHDTVILKAVDPPERVEHPRGWSGAVASERKQRSYAVEQCFYSEWLRDPIEGARTAACLGSAAEGSSRRLLLEDLDAAGYRGRSTQRIDHASLGRCLAWLARFHARFLRFDPGPDPDPDGAEWPAGLWPIGTYWHLATRRAEFDALADPALRAAAEPLDAVLSGARFQTLVHGDAKIANFCLGGDDVAAVDFQYVGGGCGIRDLAYFLSSCLSDAECEVQAETWLDCYFAALRPVLPAWVNADALEAEWRALYPAAWADFHRFLAGWAPDHWKIHRYTRRMTEVALGRLESL